MKTKRWLSGGQISATVLIFLPLLVTSLSIFFRIPFYDNAGGFQYKDAGAWASCTKALVITGGFLPGPGQWCLRRPMFPELISYLYRSAGTLSFISLALSLLFGIALYFFTVELRSAISFKASMIVSSSIFLYWFIYCCNQILTESLAIIFSLFGLIYLLKARSEKNFTYVYISIALTSISQQIRPGNLLLPLVAIVIVLGFKFSNKKTHLFYAGFLFISPYILTGIFRRILKNSDYANAGNAWASLYGLANENTGWQAAYSIPGIPTNASDAQISKVIKSATIDSIRSDIFSVPTSMLKNLLKMVTTYFPFFSPISIPSAIIAVVLNFACIVLLVHLFVSRSKNGNLSKLDARIIFFVLGSTLFSFSYAWKSEPARALMPTVAFVFFAIALIAQGKSTDSQDSLMQIPNEIIGSGKVKHSTIVGGGLITILVYTISLCVYIFPTNVVTDRYTECGPGQFSLIEKSLTITRVNKIKVLSLYSWGKDLPKLKSGQLIQGIGYGEREFIAINAFLTPELTSEELKTSCFGFDLENNDLGGFSDSGVRAIIRLTGQSNIK